MNAVTPIVPAEGSCPQRQDELRIIIDEMLWGCQIYANTGSNYIELQDDAGLKYSIRQLIARIKIVRDVMLMLKEGGAHG
jgi:hypothetical protein